MITDKSMDRIDMVIIIKDNMTRMIMNGVSCSCILLSHLLPLQWGIRNWKVIQESLCPTRDTKGYERNTSSHMERYGRFQSGCHLQVSLLLPHQTYNHHIPLPIRTPGNKPNYHSSYYSKFLTTKRTFTPNCSNEIGNYKCPKLQQMQRSTNNTYYLVV